MGEPYAMYLRERVIAAVRTWHVAPVAKQFGCRNTPPRRIVVVADCCPSRADLAPATPIARGGRLAGCPEWRYESSSWRSPNRIGRACRLVS